MPIDRSLLELQKIDSTMLRLQREKAKIDDGSQVRSQCDTVEKALAIEEENLNTFNRIRADAEAELQKREEKLRTQQTRLMNAKSAHEISSLQRDIESITKSRGELDEAILTAMDDVETCAKKVDQYRAGLKELRVQLTRTESAFKKQTAQLDEELLEAARERNAKAAQIDQSAKEKYDQVASRHGGIAVSEVVKGNCSVCGTMITPYNLKEAKSLEWPTCESCGRLLFVE